MLAIVYALTLPEPAMGVLLNCLAFLGAGLLARRMALLFGAGRKGALLPAVLVVLWPPSLLYSPLLLKDSLAVFAAFLFIAPPGGNGNQPKRLGGPRPAFQPLGASSSFRAGLFVSDKPAAGLQLGGPAGGAGGLGFLG